MSEEIKNEQENLDEKINEMLNDSSFKTEEDKKLIKDIGESLKKGEVPTHLILNKSNDAFSKLNELKNTNPEFESFVKHYETKLNEALSELTKLSKNIN